MHSKHMKIESTPQFVYRFNRRYMRDFYFIRLFKGMGFKWQPHKNVDAFYPTAHKFGRKLNNTELSNQIK